MTQPLGSSPRTDPDAHARFMMLLHNYVYGSPTALEFLWKKKYLDHNECVVQQVPSSMATQGPRVPGPFPGVGGWGGIRTHETRKGLPVFKTGAFNRSATHPSSSRGTPWTP